MDDTEPSRPSAAIAIGKLLRQHRLAAGLTQESLAERAGLSMHGIQKLERGASHPHRDTVERLIAALQLGGSDAALFKTAAQPAPRRRQAHLTASTVGEPKGPNLPLRLTSFVGRQRELAELERLFGTRETACRLLTLVGPGGVGKTRLAVELAARMAATTPDVVLLELEPLVNSEFLLPTVAAALGVHEQPVEPLLDTVRAAIVHRPGLVLLLDNCEHLLEACALLVERLLRSCPDVRVLATSRERLDVPGEVIHQVTGLALPAEGAIGEDVTRSEAGQLFMERVHRLAPDLAVDEQGAAALARICRRLDGIPLAIELAATAARGLSLEDLALRLDDRFRLLRDASPTTSPRHQTLRAVMDWSHQLLDADEALLFRRLAVFVGGFGLDALEAVHGPDALSPLLRLIDKSLVVVEWRGRLQRYRLLETIRHYAEEKLVDSGEAAAMRDRHRDYYLALAEEAIGGLSGPDQVAWLERLETEHDNLRAALAWCQADPQGAENEERLAGALGRFWRDRGYIREGYAWLTHAAARRPGAVSVGRGRALNWAAVVAQFGEVAHEQQAALLEEAVSVLRQADAPAELSLALRHLWVNVKLIQPGTTTVDAGLVEEAVALARRAGDRREIGWGLLFLMQVALNRGDLAEARRLVEEAVTTLRDLDPNSILQALIGLGRVALAQGEHARAETAFREMVDRSHAIGDRLWLADAWLGLAGAVRVRDLDESRDCFRALVSELRGASSAYLLPRVLLGLVMLEAGAGHDRRAARLLGAFEASGGHAAGWPLDGYQLGPDLATIRLRLEREACATAIAEGRTLTVDQALDEALADAP